VFTLSFPLNINCCTTSIDFRKSYDGLCGEVRNSMKADPMCGALFVFFNKRRDKIKMLLWDRDGYWVFQKRLEAGTFQYAFSSTSDGGALSISQEQLQLLLYGIDLQSVKHRKRYSVS
jgi:transposase